MSKAPAFQFYAADYLADEAVNLMSLEAEGAYTRLLAYCWREGSIPANEAQLSRLCKGAPADVISEVIGCFYADPTQPGRLLHKRLESERAKQEEYRARQAAKGQKGGRPRKPDESPEKPPAFAGLNRTKADEKPDESSLSSTSSSITSDDVNAGEDSSSALPKLTEPEPLQANVSAPTIVAVPPAAPADPAKAAALATTDPGDEIHWSVGPLTRPESFRIMCERLPHGVGIAHEYYRKLALVAAEDNNTSRTIKQWGGWISKFLANQRPKGGRLLTLADLANILKL